MAKFTHADIGYLLGIYEAVLPLEVAELLEELADGKAAAVDWDDDTVTYEEPLPAPGSPARPRRDRIRSERRRASPGI
jgi:hypothetical protein